MREGYDHHGIQDALLFVARDDAPAKSLAKLDWDYVSSGGKWILHPRPEM